jgi:hypothetical protein
VVLPASLHERYIALVAGIATDVDAALGATVAANRVAVARVDPAELVLRPWRRERVAFVRRLSALAAGTPCLAIADVRACYASIAPGAVERSLTALGVADAPAAGIRRFLEGLADEGIRGLPIGPDPSAVLANAVLAGVDRALSERSGEHLRWVDDIVVACRGPEEARAVLELVRLALADVGLRPNERKTRVVRDPVALARRPSVSRTGRGQRVG